MTEVKIGLHPRNRHRGRYDFKQLIKSCSELEPFVAVNKYREESIDFSNPLAVKALNKAILKHFYEISWDIPENYLCPAIPGRADYIHHIADLLKDVNSDQIPTGKSVRILDVGVGANCVYPFIGHKEYGWSFLGSDIDKTALSSAQQLVSENRLADSIELRLQTSPSNIFKGIVEDKDMIDVSICNPPFHSSQRQAREGVSRKWKNLGIKTSVLNFGGQSSEICCFGGEAAFVTRMIEESALIQSNCLWFSSLISKEGNLPKIYDALKQATVLESKVIHLAQGQKRSRIVAWTFLDKRKQAEWREKKISI